MAEQNVTLNPGESKVVSFEAIPHEAKTYQVLVDGLAGSFVGIAPVGLIGDLNDDGVVNVLDLTILQKYVGGYPISQISPLSEAEFLRRADVNGDGVVNTLDITALETLIGGEPPPPPATGMITLYMTGTPTQEWTAGWYYADEDKFRYHLETYHGVPNTRWRAPDDPCTTPPEYPIDPNNMIVKITTYSEVHVCPHTGYRGNCNWGNFGPFIVRDGGVYTIDVTTGELTEVT